MKEIGIVKAIRGNIAEIRAATVSECSQCPLRDSCSSSHLSNKNSTILAWNNVKAEVGDLVEFEYEERDIIKGIFTIYMIPFFFFLAGLILGLILEKGLGIHIGKLENFLSVLTSVGFLFVGIFVVKEKDKNFRIPSTIISVIMENPLLNKDVNVSPTTTSEKD